MSDETPCSCAMCLCTQTVRGAKAAYTTAIRATADARTAVETALAAEALAARDLEEAKRALQAQVDAT